MGFSRSRSSASNETTPCFVAWVDERNYSNKDDADSVSINSAGIQSSQLWNPPASSLISRTFLLFSCMHSTTAGVPFSSSSNCKFAIPRTRLTYSRPMAHACCSGTCQDHSRSFMQRPYLCLPFLPFLLRSPSLRSSARLAGSTLAAPASWSNAARATPELLQFRQQQVRVDRSLLQHRVPSCRAIQSRLPDLHQVLRQ